MRNFDLKPFSEMLPHCEVNNGRFSQMRLKPRRFNQKAYQKKKRDFIKLLKETKGGKCEICGYDKNYSCLDFHHFVGEKKFNITQAKVKSYKKILEEVIKCKLLCKNCHIVIMIYIILNFGEAYPKISK